MATETRHKNEKASGAPEIVRRSPDHAEPRRWQAPSQQARRGRKVDIAGHDDSSPRTKS